MQSGKIQHIIQTFFPSKTLFRIKALDEGNINKTFLVYPEEKSEKYILQQINTHVFKNPIELMHNFVYISQHIEKKLKAKDFYKNFKAYPSRTGEWYHIHSDRSFWRMIEYIDAKTIDNQRITSKIASEAGWILGFFHHILADIDVSLIKETIPNFHHVDLHYTKFTQIISTKPERLEKTLTIARKIKENQKLIKEFIRLKNKQILPKRIVHNDPKLGNILFDKQQKACTMIDLDTCMQGYLNVDFGDAIRSICNTSNENEQNLSKVDFDSEIFKHFTQSYLDAVKEFILPIEKEYLAFFVLLITYEQLIRFYNDYLQNDIYYTIKYPNHNLDRTKVQLKLFEKMLDKYDEMKKFITDK